ncbi:MAG: type VI secretion protein [Betaproteobacteria bacterium RBG_16_58_11]|nr:MAG: type VI secretion protein [Betaproteobacteria bacterium RBG_16_58_11]
MKYLRNGKVLTTIGFILMIVLIWLVGPFMGLETSVARLVAIFILMGVWVATLMIGKLLAERAGSLLERMLRKQADDAVMGASPGKRTEVSHIRTRLLESIETLKKSNLGKTRGKAALYELPWYMIIGHTAAGKSSAIQYSGLTFPFADKGKTAVQGVGGTRNCDWFFTSESVLLDTAGRYSTQNEERAEWIEFLKLLKHYRPRTPVNGIILTMSFPELVQNHAETFAVYARQVRQRINEIDDVFGVKVPVYLFFTKIDLLGGFTQFFEDFTEEERSRVWGSTLSHEQGADFDAPRVVGQHFDMLMRGLAQMGTDKLANNRGNVKRPALFAFPIEFNAMRESVCNFVQLLFEDDPYHTKPLLRGFYFTSALQEGSPQINAGNRVSSLFDLSKRGFELSVAPQSQGYFLRDTFREVLFPDQHLVGRQTRPTASRARVAGIAAGLVGLALLAAGWTWSFVGNQKLIATAQAELADSRKQLASNDLLEKLNGLHTLQLRLEQLYKYRTEGRPWEIGFGLYRGEKVESALRAEYFEGVRRVMLAPVKGNLETKLAELNPSLDLHAAPAKQGLTQTAAQIGKASLKWLAQGNTAPSRPASARDALQRLQARENRINPSAAPQAAGQQAADPQDAQPNPQEGQAKLEEYYNALKTYLMLKMRPRMEIAHLSDQLPRYWRPWLQANKGERGMADINKQAERIVAFYLSQLKETDLPLIENRDATVANSREILRGAMRRLSAKERIYNELKARGNTQYAALTVGRILENRDADTVAGSYAVPGAYTREAWDKYFRKAILEASKGEIKGDDWVLATSLADNLGRDGDVERNRLELESMYRADYVREWRKFLQGLAVSDFPNLETASVRLGKLGDAQQSPIKKIIARAAYETAWDNPSELQKTLEHTRSSVLDRVLSAGPQANSNPQQAVGEVGGKFLVLAQLAAADAGGRAALNGYLDALLKLKGRVAGIAAASEPGAASRQFMQVTLAGSASELAEALQFVDGPLLGGADQDAKDALRPLLVRPLMATYAALIPPAEADINRLWGEQVWGQWVSLSGKYPFADSSNEAQMADIAKFLRPGEGTLPKFIDRILGALVVRRGDTYVARTWANMGVDFNPGFLAGISRLTSVANAVLQEGEGSKFELQPVPTPGLSEITIEIDGQQLRYRNGPQAWTTFSWPSAANQPNAQGARLNIVSFAGVATPIASHPGRLGLMRLLAQAYADNPYAHDVRLEWRVKSAEARARDEVIPIRFNFRMVSGANPIALSGLRRVGLPEKIAN